MPHHKHHERLETLKQKILAHPELSEEEKSNAIKHIEEWYLEDQADKEFWKMVKQKLLDISAKIEPLLAEVGLI